MDNSCQARLRVAVGAEAAAALARALEVDNLSAPPGMAVTCRALSDDLICDVLVKNCNDPRKVLSLRNTIDDLLISLRAALESLGLASRRGRDSRKI